MEIKPIDIFAEMGEIVFPARPKATLELHKGELQAIRNLIESIDPRYQTFTQEHLLSRVNAAIAEIEGGD